MTTKSLKYNLPFAPNTHPTLSLPHHKNYFFRCNIENLMKEGKTSLLSEDTIEIAKGIDYFEQAGQLQPKNPEIFYKQGAFLFTCPHSEKNLQTLLLSTKKFKTATTLRPSYFDAWVSWGRSLSLLGILSKKKSYFIEAEKKFIKALSLSDNFSSEILGEVYWDYGIVLTHLASTSTEALELAKALSCFEKCSSYKKNLPYEFWNIYGKTHLKMGDKINTLSCMEKAIDCFRQNISLNTHCFNNILLLAETIGTLYLHTQNETYFLQAQNCFNMAMHIDSASPDLWHKWAVFLLKAGKMHLSIKKLKKAFHKCHQALVLKPQDPMILVTSAEILACIGSYTDQIDPIRQSQETLEQALLLSKEKSLDFWHSYGQCLYSFGSYFQDLDYYYQAIEKFQENTSTDRTAHKDWYALGRVYATIGEMNLDIDAFEKSIKFYSKAFHLKPLNSYCLEYAKALTHTGNLKEGDTEYKEFFLKSAIVYFEYIFETQNYPISVNIEAFFHYAIALSSLGEGTEDLSLKKMGLEKFFQILAIEPNLPHLHYHIGLTYSYMGEALGELEYYTKSIHHYNLEFQQGKENDTLLINWGIALINISQLAIHENIALLLYCEAEKKFLLAGLLGNEEAFYQLGCLYTLIGYQDRAMHFIQKSYLANSLPPIEELLEDDWLENLRYNPDFQALLSRLEKE